MAGAKREGREEGVREGIRQGKQQGMQKGIQQGKVEGQANLIKQLLASGMSIQQVTSVTKMTSDEVTKLALMDV